MATLDQEVQRRAARLAIGDISLAEFREWFAPVAWAANESTADSQVLDMINTIDLLIAECLRGHRSPENFRGELLALLNPVTEYRIVEHVVPQQTSTRSTSMGVFQTIAVAS